MKNLFKIALLCALAGIFGCEEDGQDVVPKSFVIELRPDDIYVVNVGETRLDPLVNDTIAVEATVSYSTPLHGTIRFIQNEGWFYKANAGYTGLDNIEYTVCVVDGDCFRSNITVYVENPYDPATCTYQINPESVTTEMNQSVEIRLFLNDQVCPYIGSSVFSPERGRFTAYSYSGTLKNIVYVYYPPANFRGTDRIRYRLATPDGFLEAFCTVTIN